MGVVSFQYVDQHQTLFRDVPMVQGIYNYPALGGEYYFDNIALPAVFSMGVIIATGEKLFTPLFLLCISYKMLLAALVNQICF